MHICPSLPFTKAITSKTICKRDRCAAFALILTGIFSIANVLWAQSHDIVSAARTHYQVVDLGPLVSVADEVAPSINDSGTISTWMPSPAGSIHAYVGLPGQFQDIGTLPGDSSSISHAINNQGQIVGWSVAGSNLVDSLVVTHAFLSDHGQLVAIGNFGGRDSQAMDVNSHGAVVGVASLANKSKHAFLYNDGKLQDLGALPGGTYSAASAINNAGWITGTAETATHLIHAVVWKDAKLIDIGTLPGGQRSQAEAINGRGSVVGFSETYGSDIHAFIYRNQTMQDLGELGRDPVRANSINDKDQIVGLAAVSEVLTHAFLWENGVLVDLNHLLSSDAKWEIRNAYSINNLGQILGSGSTPGTQGQHLLLLNPQAYGDGQN